MYRLSLRVSILVCVLAIAGSLAGAQEEQGLRVYRVYYESMEDIGLLQDFDLFEFNERTRRYVLVGVGDERELARLEAVGLRLELDEKETASLQRPEVFEGVGGIPGFPCYRTVEETYASAAQLAFENPTLAQWIDIGDSWEKNNGPGGHDLMVLKMTNSDIPGPKPKLIMTSSIHAREYTPAETSTRFAEMLINGHGIDADLTWILDYHEVHLILHANPDGRKQAETGILWRKNTNQDYCGPTSPSRGADLNRNWEFRWGCCNGSSSSQCSNTYRGPSSASEPEVATYQAYLRQEFPDQRGPDLSDPAPIDATGVYIDMHSYSELVLWPWGFGGGAPNEQGLTTLGRKLAYWNGYFPTEAIGLYVTDGTTIDFAYGDLGVASYVYELGTSFFQSCNSFENQVLPENLPSLVYAAKAARTPYMTPAGPDALDLALSDGPQAPGVPLTLSAIIDSTRYENGNGAQPLNTVAGASYTIDTPPWMVGVTPVEMAAVDSQFDSTVEAVSASVDTAGLTPGRHTLFVEGRDNDGNRGAVTAIFVDLTDPMADDDSDGTSNMADCAPQDGAAWSVPSAPRDLQVGRSILTWSSPAAPGAMTINYEVLRSSSVSDFDSGVCVSSGLTLTLTLEGLAPGPGDLLSYLIRSVNSCGATVEPSSNGNTREAVDCF